MTTSREIVKQTLAYAAPPRLAHSFPPDSDIVGAVAEIPNPQGEWRKVGESEWQRVDEWGNVWSRVDDTSKGEVSKGALEDLDQVDTFPLPDFDNPNYYQKAAEIFAEYPHKYHLGGLHGMTFSIARYLRRFEQYLSDVLLEPEKIHRLHDRADEEILKQIIHLKRVGADAIFIVEDWGTQLDMLVSPALFRTEFKPRFKRLIGAAKDLGMATFMHSCGKMTKIIPDLIECGVDVFEFDQPKVHGLDTLAHFQDDHQVTFWCPVDIQTTLQTKNEAVIRAEARRMIEMLWRGRGGFIAYFYPDNPSLGLEPQWQEIAFDEFQKASREYRKGGR